MKHGRASRHRLRHLADAITGIRIVCAAGLMACPPISICFIILYLIGGISDVLDGITARRLGIAVIKVINLIQGMVTRKRLVAEHTVPNKICGILLYALPFCIGFPPDQPTVALILLTCGTATFAAVHEGYCVRQGREIS